jgi:epoxyqueuosine reductase
MHQMDSQAIIDLCLSQGFALAGIAKAHSSRHESSLQEWLAHGKQGEMEWMNRNVDLRLDPRKLLDGAKSVICVADRYGELNEPPLQKDHGRIARYARGKDYHKVMKKRLHEVSDILRQHYPEETFRGCVDTAPLLEREFASRAGLGAIGKHTLLIEQGIGSWLLLGAIVTTAKFSPTNSQEQDPCGTCTRCIDACPTEAITPWSVDARKCISYLTIEHRTEIDSAFFPGVGTWLFGCDICQEVCPHNQPTERGEKVLLHEEYTPIHDSLDVLDVLRWDEHARQVHFRGSSMKRAKLGMMRRNAVIVAGNILENETDNALHDALRLIAKGDEDEMVRNTAIAVLKQLVES